MTFFRRLAKLDPLERVLLFRAVVWIICARAGLRVLPYRPLCRLLERGARHPIDSPCSPEMVRWALSAAARRLPGTRCLSWALAARGLLAQAGIPSELRIGVTKSEDRFLAHAWVECRGLSLSWGDDERSYTPLTTAPGGRP